MRKVLLGMGGLATLLILIASLGVQLPRAHAQGFTSEILYLADSGPSGVADGFTTLFRVELAGGTAALTPLPDAGFGLGRIPLNEVAALACSTDGGKLWAIDKFVAPANVPNEGWLGYYDLSNATFALIGPVVYANTTTPVPEIVLAAMSTDGKLYAASDSTNQIYIVDTGTAEATSLGYVYKQGTTNWIDIQGADLVFDAVGQLYLWTNNTATGRGLYLLTLPAIPGGQITAVAINTSYPTGIGYFTGLAIRENGAGDLIGSQRIPYSGGTPSQGHVYVIDKLTGLLSLPFLMTLGGNPYLYQYGDMTAGQLVLCTKTIGYWKNHGWDGETVSICGELIDEELGQQILGDARGNNYSMFVAQLIAAKLNVGSSPLIAEAEAWLCGKIVNFTGEWWNTAILKTDKKQASEYWEALDFFNNEYHCDE